MQAENASFIFAVAIAIAILLGLDMSAAFNKGNLTIHIYSEYEQIRKFSELKQNFGHKKFKILTTDRQNFLELAIIHSL